MLLLQRSRSILTLVLLLITLPIYGEDNLTLARRYRQEALAYRNQEQFDRALELLQKSVSLAPQDSNGWLVLGWTQHLAGRSEQSAQSLWQAVYLQSPPTEALNALGIVYLVRGELSTAIILHSWASLLKPDNEIAYYNLSLAYHRQKSYDLALAYAQTAVALEPANPHPYLALALAHGGLNQQEQAIEHLRSALSLNSQYSDRDYQSNLLRAGFHQTQIDQVRAILEQSR